MLGLNSLWAPGAAFELAGSAAIRRFVIPDYPAAHVPLWAVVVSFAFCAGIGVLFGSYPAMKAAAQDPLEALRYE